MEIWTRYNFKSLNKCWTSLTMAQEARMRKYQNTWIYKWLSIFQILAISSHVFVGSEHFITRPMLRPSCAARVFLPVIRLGGKIHGHWKYTTPVKWDRTTHSVYIQVYIQFNDRILLQTGIFRIVLFAKYRILSVQ